MMMGFTVTCRVGLAHVSHYASLPLWTIAPVIWRLSCAMLAIVLDASYSLDHALRGSAIHSGPLVNIIPLRIMLISDMARYTRSKAPAYNRREIALVRL